LYLTFDLQKNKQKMHTSTVRNPTYYNQHSQICCSLHDSRQRWRVSIVRTLLGVLTYPTYGISCV